MSEKTTDELPDARIRRLIAGQRYCILCTAGEGQPYGSLICFAWDEQRRQIAFSTPRTTRKHALLSRNASVALMFDNRSTGGKLMDLEAVTATGTASEVPEASADHAGWRARLIERYPDLRAFFSSPSCAVYVVDVVRFFHVARFQEVFQWPAE